MITNKDARELVERLRRLSEKHEVTDADSEILPRYAQGQHDGRRDAYALAARMVEECNRKEAENAQAP